MQLKFGLPAKHSCPVHKPQIKAKGFFRTRFVEATSPEEAACKAIEAVREEMNAFLSNDPQDVWTLSVVEVWEDA